MIREHRSLLFAFALIAVMGVGCCGCGGMGGSTSSTEEKSKSGDELWATDKAKAVEDYKKTYDGFWTSKAEKTRILPRIVEVEVKAGHLDEASEWVSRGIKDRLDIEYKDPVILKMVATIEKANEEAREEEATAQAKKAEERAARAKKEDGGSFGRKNEAWVLAQELVAKLLKSPSTASFGGLFSEQNPKANVRWGGGGKYQAHGWVDSQNAFGATVRCDFRNTSISPGRGVERGKVRAQHLPGR